MKVTTSYNPTHVPFRSLDVGDCFYYDNEKEIFMKMEGIIDKDFTNIATDEYVVRRNAVSLNTGKTYRLGSSVLIIPVECELVAKIK